MGSQDNLEALVPEQEGLLDPQWAQGNLSVTLPTCRTSAFRVIVSKLFLTETGSAHNLEAGNFPLSFSFLLCEMGINAA